MRWKETLLWVVFPTLFSTHLSQLLWSWPAHTIKTSAGSEQALGNTLWGKKRFHQILSLFNSTWRHFSSLSKIQAFQKITQASHPNEFSRTIKSTSGWSDKDFDDHPHNDNTIISIPLSSCGKDKQAESLQKVHYGSVGDLILLATAETESIFHWLWQPQLWCPAVTATEPQLCVCDSSDRASSLFSSQSCLFQVSCFVSGITNS